MTEIFRSFLTLLKAVPAAVLHWYHRMHRYWVTEWWDPLLTWIYPPQIRCQACSALLLEQAATPLAEWFPDSPDLSNLPIPSQMTPEFDLHEATIEHDTDVLVPYRQHSPFDPYPVDSYSLDTHDPLDSNEPQLDNEPLRLAENRTIDELEELKLLTRTFEQHSSMSICRNCKGLVHPHETLICDLCGRSIEANFLDGSKLLCSDCKGRMVSFVSARSFGPFRSGLQQWIARYKFGREMELEPVLGHLLILAYWKYYRDVQIDGIVPVPLHPYRMKERGFNQAERLARFLIPYACVPCFELLTRTDLRKSQTAYSKQGRVSGIKQLSIIPHEDFQLKGSQLLLIDDVYTTGTTVNTCSEVLKQAGVDEVYVLTLGR